MSKKTLNEVELKKFLREIIALDELHKAGLITNEGIWSKIKYGLGKLGSLEKGGKFFGRGKASDEAEAELQAILNKADEASKKTIKALYDGIQEKYPEFPNQEDQQQYARALTDVYVFYDSLVQAAKKKPGTKGHFPCVAANELIADLKKVVKKWTDYDLADVYKHLTEEQKRLLAESYRSDEAREELFDTSSIDERFMGGSKEWAKIAAAEEVDDQGRIVKPGGAAPAGPAGEQEKTSRLGGGELATIEGLKSNLLPAALGLTGAAALIAAYIASQPTFVNWLAGKLGAGQGLNPKTLTTEIGGAVDKTIGPLRGEGFTQMFGRLTGIQGPGQQMFQAGDPVSNLFEEFGKYGINPKNPTALFELGVDKASYMERLASGATTIGEMFPASDKGLWLKLGKQTTVKVAQAITKKVVTGTGTAAAATAAATGTAAMAGPLLAGLGVALIASGAAVKLIRMKGLQSSRAKSLKTLFDALKPVDCEDTPPPPPPPPGQCTDEEEAQGKVWRDDLDPPACDCPEGMVFSEKAGKCIKDEVIVENCGYMGLKDGTNPETGEPGCVCPDTGKFVPTEHWDDWQETGWCKDDDEGKCSDEETAQGKEWNEEAQACVCPEGLVEDPETGKCVKQPPIPPPPERPTRPGIAVLDDDEVSIFRIRWRKPDKVDAQKDVYKAAEDATIIGRKTDPTSDQVAGPSFEYRPFKANAKTFAQIKKKAQGKSGVEPHFAIDGSIISDLANKSGKSRGARLKRAGLGKDIAIRLAKEAFKAMLRDERKLAGEEAEKIMAQLGVDDEGKRALALAQMQAYGLVQPERAKKRRRKARAAVQEAKQLDRWKVLSGIK